MNENSQKDAGLLDFVEVIANHTSSNLHGFYGNLIEKARRLVKARGGVLRQIGRYHANSCVSEPHPTYYNGKWWTPTLNTDMDVWEWPDKIKGYKDQVRTQWMVRVETQNKRDHERMIARRDSHFLIVCEDGKFVAKSDTLSSYTTELKDARLFESQENAKKNVYGNEQVIPLSSVLQPV
jgi:hypothetical protein